MLGSWTLRGFGRHAESSNSVDSSDDSAMHDYTTKPILQVPQHALPVPQPVLNESQEEKLAGLRVGITPSIISAEIDSKAHESEKAWLIDACLMRYLRARKWDVELARKELENSLKWRREYKPESIPPEEIEPEEVTGKTYLNGFDLHGRPNMYFKTGRENCKPSSRQIRNVVFNMENAIAMMPEGVETLNIIIDFEGSSASTAPGVSISKQFVDVLANQYPERIGSFFLINTPWFFWPFFKIVGPFIDPVTRSKMKFVDLKTQLALAKEARAQRKANDILEASKPVTSTESDEANKDEEPIIMPTATHKTWVNLYDYIAPEQLESDYGGEHWFKWEFADYWQTLLHRMRTWRNDLIVDDVEKIVVETAIKEPTPQLA
ncbi:hypothetical protein BZG36_04684 [Bifiguratus adelaidae]|uniref:CRAL-TRIO domain-containing protein n=1 Tax=Bifiguratus adelaidae TaxID=1938954 RepID=A0A261XXB8_9FUNG|nr:hypothetical protein BZG36_04684 [Bifiguratus adelaidae]